MNATTPANAQKVKVITMEKTIPEGQMLAYSMAGSADSSLIIATHGVTDLSLIHI